jgi:hypothetical protein
MRQRAAAENLVREIFAILSALSYGEHERLSHATRTGDLSKQAKIDLAIELENSSGYDWEM